MKKIPFRWILVAGIAYLAFIAFFSLAFIFPQNLKIKELKTRLHSDAGLSSREEELKNIRLLRRELQAAHSSVGKKVLPPGSSVLTKLFNLTQKARIKVVSVIPATESSAEGSSGHKLFIMTTEGSYRQILEFVHLLESDQALFRIGKISIKSTEGLPRAELNIIILEKAGR